MWQVLSRLGNTAASPSLLRWKFILGERIDKYVRRTISSTEKHQLKATGRFNRKSCRLSRFDLGFNHGTLFGFVGLYMLFLGFFSKGSVYLVISTRRTLTIVTGLYITTEHSRFSASCQNALFLPKQVSLLGISTRVTCRNASLNHSGGPYLVSPSVSQCKSYGGPLCLQLVTYNRKPEETVTMQNFAYLF